MSTRKKFTRNEMKAFLNILKDELEVEYNTRDITSLDGCKQSLKEIVDIYMSNKKDTGSSEIKKVFHISLGELEARYDAVRSENIFLKSQIEQLKNKKANKKWWKFWEWYNAAEQQKEKQRLKSRFIV